MDSQKQEQKGYDIMYMDFDTGMSNDRMGGCFGRKMSCGCSESGTGRSDNGCGCSNGNSDSCYEQNGRTTWGLNNHPLASVYAPLQYFDNLFDKDTAMVKGTIFSELDLPFMGESIFKGGSCRG